jgi:DNA-binding MarR family transcriptional regulator
VAEFLDLYSRTSKVLRAATESGMRELGLHVGQNHLLAALWELDGQTPGQLAEVLHVTTPTVVKAATRMANAGLLFRRRDPADNRLVRLWLTGDGRALQPSVEAQRDTLEQRLLANLTEDERTLLISTLRKVCRAAEDLQSRS